MPTTTSPPPRVLIVAEDPLARAGLVALLENEPAVRIVERLLPPDRSAASHADVDVVLWDLGSGPGAQLEGPEGSEDPAPPVLALAPDSGAAAQALSAGARGALPRDAPVEAVVAALVALTHGLLVVDGRFPGLFRALSPREPAAEALTPREREVLQLLSEGLSNPAIGERLGISEHTAKFHVNAILQKLGAQGRTDAVMRAARLGLLLI